MTKTPTSARAPLGLALNLWERMSTWNDTVEIVRCADELGWDCVVLPESFGRDGFTLCDRLLSATERIHVCLGIANVYSRSPAVLAAASATLDEFSGGRFTLGLGASTPNLIEGWHGLRHERPVTRLRESVEMCHRIWARDRSAYEGSVFRAEGVKLAFEPLRERIPIWFGALLPRSLALCGELADGWMPTLYPADGLDVGRQEIAKGARRAGRDPSEVCVAPTLQWWVTDAADEALGLARFGVAIYYGPANSPYARAAARLGYEEDVRAVAEAYASGGSAAAAAATSDRLARSLCVAGPIEDCRERVDTLLHSGADRVLLGMPAATRAGCEAWLAGVVPGRFRS